MNDCYNRFEVSSSQSETLLRCPRRLSFEVPPLNLPSMYLLFIHDLDNLFIVVASDLGYIHCLTH
jgi:hypothetical protein